MGVRSTHDITRQVAEQCIHSYLHECTDEQIAGMLECMPHSTFRNYWIVKPEELGTGEYPSPTIKSIEEFKFKF